MIATLALGLSLLAIIGMIVACFIYAEHRRAILHNIDMLERFLAPNHQIPPIPPPDTDTARFVPPRGRAAEIERLVSQRRGR